MGHKIKHIRNQELKSLMIACAALIVCAVFVTTAWATISVVKPNDAATRIERSTTSEVPQELPHESRSRAPEPTTMTLFGSGIFLCSCQIQPLEISIPLQCFPERLVHAPEGRPIEVLFAQAPDDLPRVFIPFQSQAKQELLIFSTSIAIWPGRGLLPARDRRTLEIGPERLYRHIEKARYLLYIQVLLDRVTDPGDAAQQVLDHLVLPVGRAATLFGLSFQIIKIMNTIRFYCFFQFHLNGISVNTFKARNLAE